jgi:hypothetical protein
MKYKVSFSIIYILIFGCSNPESNVNLQTYADDNKQKFAEHQFKIDCPYEINKVVCKPTEDYCEYRATSPDKKTIYTISVYCLSQKPEDLKDFSSQQLFREKFLDKYMNDLKEKSIQYQQSSIYACPAIEFAKVTGSTSNKQTIFVCGNLAYTLSVITDYGQVDSVFNLFSASFELYYESSKFSYSVEIPRGFIPMEKNGANVDLHYEDDHGGSIVIVVKEIPLQYSKYNLWDLVGDIETFGSDWEAGAKEHMTNPRFIKCGKTEINGIETLWYDHSTDVPYSYSKNYQLKKGNLLYTITLSSEYDNYTAYSKIWLRFKDKIRIN